MHIDYQNTFDPTGTALTATRVSTNYLDTRGAGDVGIGCPLYVDIVVHTLFASGGSSTLTVTLETDDNTSFSSATTLWTSGAIPKASLVKGYRLQFPVPVGAERYLQLRYTVGTADFTAGKLNAFLLPEQGQNDRVYATTVPTP
ncbi:major capsid protein [Caudoviricetes sp.]|nr:major capsid protein [Caudoviricetes sp.]